MKNISYSILALAAAFMATGCSNDIDLENPAGDGVVTLGVQLPREFQTRAYGDGALATTLRYAVYEAGSTYPIVGEDNDGVRTTYFVDGSLSTNVSLQLVKGKQYDIIFWADNDAAAYDFNVNTKSVSINYGAVNDESRDAFYGKYSTGVISGPVKDDVTLVRPFAQVNLGTDDLGAAEVKRIFGEAAENLQTSVTTTAYKSLNLFTGDVDGEETVTLTQAAIPTGENALFPVNPVAPEPNPYQRIQMVYLLVPQDNSCVADFTFNTHVGTGEALPNPVKVTNVPLQANYRTNIYGSILTNPVDITVTKNPEWALPDYPVEIWSGGSIETLNAMIAAGGNISIAAPVEAIDLSTYTGTKPLSVNIAAEVGSVKIGASDQMVTVNVQKDVKFPTLKNPSGNNISNLTLIGDVETSEPFNSFVLVKDCSNITFKNIRFDGAGTARWAIQEYGKTMENITFSGCVFANYSEAPVSFQGKANSTNSIVVENCIFDQAEAGIATANAAYLLDFKDVVVKDCEFKNCHYNSIFVRAGNSAVVTGNKVINSKADAIKIEGTLGAKSIVVADNYVQAKVNGIRIKNATAAESIIVTGNTVDMTVTNEYNSNDDEPYGIILQLSSTQTSTPVVKVKDNVKVGESSYWFRNQMQIASGSDIATPFK